MTEQETILFQRPKTIVDEMFSAAALYLGVATRVVTEKASKAHDNLQGVRTVETERFLDMFGLRARKIRTPRGRRMYYVSKFA